MKKILVIQYSRQIEDNLVTVLLLLNYNVLIVRDGNTGQQALYYFKPDLIITDINLPGMNGIEFIHELRIDPKNKHIPVIAFSDK